MVQYVFEDEPHHVSPKKHGNAKGSKRFYPTSKSTKNNIIKRVCSCQDPSKIYVQALDEAVKMLAVKAVSDPLRNARQVEYEWSKLWPKAEADELASFLHKVEIVCSVDSMPTSYDWIKGSLRGCCFELPQF